MEYRMYYFVIYQLSGIQKGIQAGHALQEYELMFKNEEKYRQWGEHDKTFIILNGGTTNDGLIGIYGKEPQQGGMQELFDKLSELSKQYHDFNFSWFHEPDLNNAMTAMAFLVDERVYDYEKYPDILDYLFICGITQKEINDYKFKGIANDGVVYFIEKWKTDVLGGELNYQLRELLRGKKTA